MYSEEQRRRQRARERLERRKNHAQDRVQPTSARRKQPSQPDLARKQSGFLARFALPLAAVAVVALAFFAGNMVTGQAGNAASPDASATAAPSTASRSSQQDPDTAIDTKALRAILTEDQTELLVERAKSSTDAYWIATHPEAYASDGIEVQYKILKLAAEEPAATTYVRNWPDDYPTYEQDTTRKDAIRSKATGNAKVPMLYQWDPRWAYTVYSSTTFGLTGCCPTTFAMVYQGVTGKTDMTPYDMGMLAQNGGYMATFEGTDANFLINEAPGLGMSVTQLVPTSTAIIEALNAGKVIIANVGPGDFTTDGHFIVVTGTENGKLIVNDPYSSIRSEKLWDPEEIIIQTKLFLAYEKL